MTFTQDAAYEHAPGSDEAANVYSIDVVITDSDGNEVTRTVNVDITDDQPTAVADVDSVVEGGLIGDGDVLGNDTAGADGFAADAVVAVGTTSGATGGVGSAITGSKGTLTLNADGSYDYDANPGTAPGTDTFYYTVIDSDGDTSEATLTITIGETDLGGTVSGDIQSDDAVLNDATDTAQVQGTGGSGGYTYAFANATDATAPGVGTFSIDATTGVVTFTQDAAYEHAPGSDEAANVYSIDVVITDSDGNEVTRTVNVDITDDQPTAVADVDSVVEGGLIGDGDVLGNDTAGADGFAADAVVAVGTTSGATGGVGSAITGSKGTLTLNADGSYDYDANPGTAPGTDTFYYTVIDSDGDTSEATLTITIGETDLGGTVSGDIQSDDAVLNDATDTAQVQGTGGSGDYTYAFANATDATAPGVGTFSIDATTGVVTFTQDAAYEHAPGSDEAANVYSIDVVITDSDGNEVTRTVNVDITDDQPTAVADTGGVAEGATLTVAAAAGVLADDTLGADGAATGGAVVGIRAAGGDTTTAVTTGVNTTIAGVYGDLVLQADGSYVYEADTNAVPPAGADDVFVYTIEDGDGDQSTTTLTITVTDSGLTVSYANDIQSDDAVLNDATDTASVTVSGGVGAVTYALDGADANGEVVVAGLGKFQINSSTGDVTFLQSDAYAHTVATNPQIAQDVTSVTVIATDSVGNTATADVEVDIADDAPTAVADTDGVAEGATLTVAAAAGVLADDTLGADGAATGGAVVGIRAAGGDTTTAVTTGVNTTIAGVYGDLVLQADGSYVYEADTNAVLPAGADDVFVYTIEDGDGDQSTTTLTITVTDSGLTVSYANDIQSDDAVLNDATDTASVTVSGGVGAVTYALDGADANGEVVVAGLGKFQINSSTGDVTFLQSDAYAHTVATNPQIAQDVTSVTVIATDSVGNTATADVEVDIADDAPTAVADTDGVAEGATLTVAAAAGVLADDTLGADGAATGGAVVGIRAAGGDTTTAVTTGVNTTIAGVYGDLVLQADGSYVYEADTNAVPPAGADDVFVYTIEDGDGDQSTTTLTITVTDSGLTVSYANDIQSDDAVLNDATDTASVTVSGGVGAVTYALDGADANGEVVVAGLGKFQINSSTGDVTFLQSDAYAHTVATNPQIAQDVTSVTVIATDSVGNTATADVEVDIADDAPTAVADTDGVAEGATLTVAAAAGVLADDTLGADGAATGGAVVGIRAAGGDTTTAVTTGVNTTIAGVYGDLVLQADGSYVYEADTNAVPPAGADDVFVYTIEDGDGDQSTTTLTITVTDSGLTVSYANDIQSDDAVLNDATDTASVTVSGGVGAVTYALDGADANGEVVVAGLGKFQINSSTGDVTFLQSDAYAHTVATNPQIAQDVTSVTVIATDSVGNTATADVEVDIADDAPTAVADTDGVAEGATLTVAAAAGVLADDTLGADGAATGGAVVGIRAAGGDTTTAVTTGVNTTIAGVYGDLVLQADGSYVYEADTNAVPPAGADDVFVYTIEDGDGDQSTTTLTITVTDSGLTVSYANDIQSDDAVLNDATDTASVTVSGGVGAVTYALDGADANGEVVVAGLGKFQINSSTGDVTFLQSDAYAHTVATNPQIAQDVTSVTVIATDSVGNTATADVEVDIADDAPTAVADTDGVAEGATLTVAAAAGVLADDTLGADGAATGGAVVGIRAAGGDTTTAVTTGVNTTIAGVYGDLVLQADGSYVYEADTNAVPPAGADDVFVYTIEDGDGDQSTTTLTITVTDSGLTVSYANDIQSDDAVLNDATDTASVTVSGGVGAVTYALDGADANGEVVVAGLGKFQINTHR